MTHPSPTTQRSSRVLWQRTGIEVNPDPAARPRRGLDAAIQALGDPLIRVEPLDQLATTDRPDVPLDPAGLRLIEPDQGRVRPQVEQPPAHRVGDPIAPVRLPGPG